MKKTILADYYIVMIASSFWLLMITITGCQNSCQNKQKPSDNDCAYLREIECKASGSCTYYEADKTCKNADPSIKGTCAVYQLKAACNDESKCQWIETATPQCQNKNQ